MKKEIITGLTALVISLSSANSVYSRNPEIFTDPTDKPGYYEREEEKRKNKPLTPSQYISYLIKESGKLVDKKEYFQGMKKIEQAANYIKRLDDKKLEKARYMVVNAREWAQYFVIQLPDCNLAYEILGNIQYELEEYEAASISFEKRARKPHDCGC